MLSEIAIDSPSTFTDLVEIAKSALEGKPVKQVSAKKTEAVVKEVSEEKPVKKTTVKKETTEKTTKKATTAKTTKKSEDKE